MRPEDVALEDVYQLHLFNGTIISGVAQKERMREYPLDRLNDMRALLNYGPYFADQCIAHQEEFLSVASAPRLMATGRLFRLHAALLATLGATIKLDGRSTAPLLQFVTELGKVLVQRVALYPVEEDMSFDWPFDPIPASDRQATKLALSIGWKLGELADRLGMGEHNMFSHVPVASRVNPRIIRRGFFHQRVTNYFPHQVVIGTGLTADARYINEVPIFRSKPRNQIRPEDRSFREVTVDGSAVRKIEDLEVLDGMLSAAFGAVCDREDIMAHRLNLDVRKMIVYSAELRDMERKRHRIWSLSRSACLSITEKSLTTLLGIEEKDGYAEPFFQFIKDGLGLCRDSGG